MEARGHGEVSGGKRSPRGKVEGEVRWSLVMDPCRCGVVGNCSTDCIRVSKMVETSRCDVKALLT
jgi:hypothetical protein